MLTKLMADYCRKTYFGDDNTPIQIGIYRPSVLSWSCLRKQYNYYRAFHNKRPEEIPDDIVLLLAGGIIFHRLVQSLKINSKPFWDKVEVPCSIKVPVAGGEEIIIAGRADAIKLDGTNKRVYEFKHCRVLPSKLRFEHQLQINFYMGALGIPLGCLVYVGYLNSGGIGIREFPLVFSEWHFEHLINRAQTLHVLLKYDNPPRCSCKNHYHEVNLL